MVKALKMQLLRALVSERLSTAAEEIFKLVERTIVEYEEEISHSKWVVDSRRKLLDVAKSHRADPLQISATEDKLPSGHQQPPAKWNPGLGRAEPENATSEPTDDCQILSAGDPDSSPATSENSESDRETPTEIEIPRAKKSYKCPVCAGSFSSKKTVRRHVRTHSEDKSASYQCRFCDRYFCHKSDLVVHTRIHTGEKPYECQDCHKCFAQKGNLVVHIRKHTGEKPYRCGECGQCFTKKVALDRHVEKHSGPETLISNMEQEAGSSQGEMLSQSLESDIKAFPLTIPPYDKSEFDQESLQPLCLYQIQTVDDIDRDSSAILTVDQIKTEPAGSETSDNQPFPPVNPSEHGESEEEMRNRELWSELKHLHVKRILSRRKPGKSSEPNVHFEAGTAQKPYKCPHCGKCFSLTKTLIRHVKIHTEDKPYRCQFCERNFCQKSDLVTHTRIHTGERPYQCQECQKSFAQKGNLVVHMRKHTGEKPYQCQECSCCFSQKASLDCHMQSHR
ncbi:uncharacterized protein LOC139931226 [Centroberyx gerrardi]